MLITFYLFCMCECMHACRGTRRNWKRACGVQSFAPCGERGLNLGCQAKHILSHWTILLVTTKFTIKHHSIIKYLKDISWETECLFITTLPTFKCLQVLNPLVRGITAQARTCDGNPASIPKARCGLCVCLIIPELWGWRQEDPWGFLEVTLTPGQGESLPQKNEVRNKEQNVHHLLVSRSISTQACA